MSSSFNITLTYIQVLTFHKEQVYNLLLLQDGRLVDKYQLQSVIEDKEMFSNKEWYGVFSFIKINNNLICGCPSGGILFFDLIKSIPIKRKNAHSESVSSLVKIDNFTFVSISKIGIIKIWKYKEN